MITKLTDQRVSFDNGDVVLSYQSPRQTRFPKLHEVDLTGLVSPVRLKLPNHMVNTPDLPTPCKCSEIPWHPYPEEKPENGTRRYIVQNNNGLQMITTWCDPLPWSNDIIAWRHMPPPYTPPPKKKTVRVMLHKLSDALTNTGWKLVKTAAFSDVVIEIEVEE